MKTRKHAPFPSIYAASFTSRGEDNFTPALLINEHKPLAVSRLSGHTVNTGNPEKSEPSPRQWMDRLALAHNCHDELVTALRGMFEAHESYSNEFNPSGKIRSVADWGMINDKWVAARAALNKATQ